MVIKNLIKNNLSFQFIQIPKHRNFGLDLLRFVAIFSVLLCHSLIVLPSTYSILQQYVFDGVMLFFVLSGFLIGKILVRDLELASSLLTILSFYKKRWLRTVPAYYLILSIILILHKVEGKNVNVVEATRSIYFSQNFFAYGGDFFPESWSLPVEEWFYFFVPLIALLIIKITNLTVRESILLMCIAVICLSVGVRIYIFRTTPITGFVNWNKYLRCTVTTRLDSLIVGVLGAWFYIYKYSFFKKYRKALLISGSVIFISFHILVFTRIFLFTSQMMGVWYFLIIPCSILMLLPYLYFLDKPTNSFVFKIITYGSIISYSLYLLNLTITSTLILNNTAISSKGKFLLFWPLTIGLSLLNYRFVELPFLSLRTKAENKKLVLVT